VTTGEKEKEGRKKLYLPKEPREGLTHSTLFPALLSSIIIITFILSKYSNRVCFLYLKRLFSLSFYILNGQKLRVSWRNE